MQPKAFNRLQSVVFARALSRSFSSTTRLTQKSDSSKPTLSPTSSTSSSSTSIPPSSSPSNTTTTNPAGLLLPTARSDGVIPPSAIDSSATSRARSSQEDKISSLGANPYGWSESSRIAREAPLWMLYEAEREEVPLASKKGSAEKDEKASKTLSLSSKGPQLDALGRAYGTGRRKTSVARVYIKAGDGAFVVNGKPLQSYFERITLRQACVHPLVATQSAGAFDITVTVKGGGLSGQAGAVKHGLAKALANFDPYLKPILRVVGGGSMAGHGGMIHRDPRMVERKKPGQPKARKKFQWVRR